MEDVSKNEKVNIIKTIPVPLSLKEIKENLVINTNTGSKSSKEELINQAFKLHSQGNIAEAESCYQHLINKGFEDHRIFSNYGSILKSLGKSKDALHYTRKAIDLKPDFAKLHLNLGNILRDLGNLKEAELSTRKAIKLKPDFTNAHINLGTILNDLGNLKEAELSIRKAIQLKPDSADLYKFLSDILQNNHKNSESIKYKKKYLSLKAKDINTKSNIKNVIDLFSSKINRQDNIGTFFDHAVKDHIINRSSNNIDYSYIFESAVKSKNNRFISYQERKIITHNKRLINGLPFLISQGAHSLIKWKGYDLYKTTNDIVIYSMLLNEVRPEIIVELGSGNGGSAIWMADICKSLGLDYHIFSYDIRKPSFEYDGISFIEFDINTLDIDKNFPLLDVSNNKQTLVIEDAHVNILSVLNAVNKFLKPGDYLIIEDSEHKQKEIEDFTKKEPKKFLVDQYYLDFFGTNMTCSLDSIFKVF